MGLVPVPGVNAIMTFNGNNKLLILCTAVTN